MVTETSRLEAEAPPTTEAPSLQEAEDSPLIPQEIEESESEAEGTETPTDGGAEPQEDGAAEPETPDAEQEAETEAERKERTYTEEEWRARESAKDREIAAERKAREDLAAQVQQIQRQFEQEKSSQTFQAEVQAFENKLTAQFVQAGFDEQTARSQAQEQTRIGVQAFKYAQALEQAQKELADMRRVTETTNSRETARRFADQYGVPTEKMSLLMSAGSPESMEDLAKELGTLYKRTKEQAAKREAEVSPDGPEQKIDSGGGQGGMSDDQKILAYNNGNDSLRGDVEAILRRRGQHPF